MEINLMSINFLGVLQLIFITLKLCNIIEWSWFIVFLPMMLPLILFIILIIFIGIVNR